MSLTTIAVPSGKVTEFCIKELYEFSGDLQQCANSTRGTIESDFQTFCCNGKIIDTTQDLWSIKAWRARNGTALSLDLADLVCCGVAGPQRGGIQPIPTGVETTCTQGTATPLASLAATSSANAQPYLVTYTSAAGVGSSLGDYVPTNTPYCFWADTAHGIATTSVVVPTAQITSLPPATTDRFGQRISSTVTTTRTTSVRTVSTSTSDGKSRCSVASWKDLLVLGFAAGLCLMN